MADKVAWPMPNISAANRPHWAAAKNHKLTYQQCLDCGSWIYPIAPMCQACWSERFEWRPVSGEGKISSWIVVRRAFHPAFQNEIPYVVAEVDLAEGIRVLAPVVNIEPEQLRASLPVRARFMDRSDDVSLLQFEPAKPA
jgi:uncharacterized OB-fold protein